MGQTPDEIRREIEEIREQMGETAQAIAAKLNVPARVKGRIGEMGKGLGEKLGRSEEEESDGPQFLIAGILIIGLVVGALVLWTKLRRSEDEAED